MTSREESLHAERVFSFFAFRSRQKYCNNNVRARQCHNNVIITTQEPVLTYLSISPHFFMFGGEDMNEPPTGNCVNLNANGSV